MAGRDRDPSSVRKAWVEPMLGMSAVAIVTFFLLYVIDRFATGGSAQDAAAGPIGQYFFFDQDHITDAVTGLGSMVAAVLGIVITVVSIVVQLSAERYTGVTAMFFRDKTNVRVLGFYVVACVCGVWVSLSLKSDFVPRATLLLMLLTTIVGLVMMGPYFAYVFRFLEPSSIVARIQRDAVETARRGSQGDGGDIAEAQAATLAAMEELFDITSNSISGKDKIIASRAVDALKDLAVRSLPHKRTAHEEWFRIGPSIRENPDFVAMDPESRKDLEERRTWFEWKVMRQFLGIYNEALGAMRDICYLVAIDTRYVAEAAVEHGDDELVELALRYMNSYLRATLNAKDVRTAYNVLNQYRLLVESLLRAGDHRHATAAVAHMKYYAHVSHDMKLSFVMETVAYDVATVCQLAHELETPQEDAMVRIFLEIDRPDGARSQEQALKGVRKAQAKLAAYYLSVGAEERARRIFDDMSAEPISRLRAIRGELMAVESKDFWEIIDRGRNFEFVPEPQRAPLARFFGWFDGIDRDAGDSPPPAPAAVTSVAPPPAIEGQGAA
jgi:hypothetical protein